MFLLQFVTWSSCVSAVVGCKARATPRKPVVGVVTEVEGAEVGAETGVEQMVAKGNSNSHLRKLTEKT